MHRIQPNLARRKRIGFPISAPTNFNRTSPLDKVDERKLTSSRKRINENQIAPPQATGGQHDEHRMGLKSGGRCRCFLLGASPLTGERPKLSQTVELEARMGLKWKERSGARGRESR